MKFLFNLKFNRSFILLLLSFLLSIIFWIFQPNFIIGIENLFKDSILKYTSNNLKEERVAIIDIDEISLQEIGPWPWPRSTIADLIENILIDQNSISVGLDIIFPSPSDKIGDERLKTLSSVSPVTFAYILDYNKRSFNINSGILPKKSKISNNIGQYFLTPSYGYISNHEGLSAARCSGNIGYIPDQDGVIRSLPLNSVYNNELHPLFSQALLNCAGFNVKIPNSHKSKFKLSFSKSLDSLIFISATDILNNRLPKNFLQNKHILIGSSSLALGDQVSTPLAPLVAGVTVHAAAIIDLLDIHDGIKSNKISGDFLLYLFFLICIALLFFILKLNSPIITIVSIITLIISWIFISIVTRIFVHIDSPITPPIIGLFFAFITILPFEWFYTRRIEVKLIKIFSNYVGKNVLDQLKNLNLENSLEPSSKEITVLVVDMAGYTQRIINLPLEDSAKLTRDFLSRLTTPILQSSGTLDKYMGDGLIAFWGAPASNENQADDAISCAIDMLNVIELWNKENYQFQNNPINVRIGIESGTALVGDLGTSFRSTYTAVGDCVNIASRLEALAKDLSIKIAIGPKARKKTKYYTLINIGNHRLRDTDNFIEVSTIDSPI